MAQHKKNLVLKFRPWIWARTIVYEYFCMSWATRLAAENTQHPPLAARLVGESFELAIKILSILVRGPKGKLMFGHRLSAIVGDSPELESILKELWGSDLEFILDIVDGECNPSQVRYGTSGGNSNKGNKIIPSGYAESAIIWISTTAVFYEELMLSLGQAIWSNYPDGDRNGYPVERHFKLKLAKGTLANPIEMSVEEESVLQNEKGNLTEWAYLLRAETTDVMSPYWGIIPRERLNNPKQKKYFVRVRISRSMVVDVEVERENSGGFLVGGARVLGQEDVKVSLTINAALAELPYRGE